MSVVSAVGVASVVLLGVGRASIVLIGVGGITEEAGAAFG